MFFEHEHFESRCEQKYQFFSLEINNNIQLIGNKSFFAAGLNSLLQTANVLPRAYPVALKIEMERNGIYMKEKVISVSQPRISAQRPWFALTGNRARVSPCRNGVLESVVFSVCAAAMFVIY